MMISQGLASGCDKKSFPKGFAFGVSSSAFQIEGAWKTDGKSETIWDYGSHNKSSFTIDHSNGDIACNSYNLFKRDVEMLRELGVNFYRFSLSWARILPSSFANEINHKGVAYYNKLIGELLKNKITPVVTVHHIDLPQRLQEMGGWTNPYIIDWFADYSRVCYKLFGDRVKHWVTMNEPHQVCYFGYGSKLLEPASDIEGVAEYMCAKNSLLAHAKAYHIYEEEFRPTQGGTIGIALAATWYEPGSRSQANVEAARDALEFSFGLYAHPIFTKTGDFPKTTKKRIAIKSKNQGFPRPRLPKLTPTDIEYIRGTADFLGLNHYFTNYVNRTDKGHYDSPSFMDDCGAILYQAKEWRLTNASYTYTTPWGFYKLLESVRVQYNNVPIIILENGYANGGGLRDADRVSHLRNYMCAMLVAMGNGCNVQGYSVWSLMDNFEWTNGYTWKFGLYQVNFSDPNRTRTPRMSAYVYREVLRTRMLNYSYVPDMSVPMTVNRV